MGRRHDAVGLGRLLGLAVVEVGIGVVVILRADFHFVERVAEIGIAELVQADGRRVVGRDRHHGDTLVAIVGLKPRDSPFVGLGRRAMVAGEDDEQHLGLSEVRQAVGLAVDAGQSKSGAADPIASVFNVRRIGDRRVDREEAEREFAINRVHMVDFIVRVSRCRATRGPEW